MPSADRATVVSALLLAWFLFFVAAGVMREIIALPWGLWLRGAEAPTFSLVGMLFRLVVYTALSMVHGLIALVPLLLAGLVAPRLVRRWWWAVLLVLLVPLGQVALELVNSQAFGWRFVQLSGALVPDWEAPLVLVAGTATALIAGRRTPA
jgi:hypothetical protein